MNLKDRIEEAKQELLNTDLFNAEELQYKINDTYYIVFESWEYYQIFYLTNEELYYQDEEEAESFKAADNILDTEKGRAFCFS